MKEKLIKIILEHTDEDLRVIDLVGLVDAIEALYAEYEGHWMYPTDWASIDPKKWGDLWETNNMWEEEDESSD